MKILVTTSVRWWNACAYNAISLAKNFQERGHHVWVAGKKDSPALIKAHDLNLKVLEDVDLASRPVPSLWRLTQFIKANQIDIINAHNGNGHSIAALLKVWNRSVLVRTRGDIRPTKSNVLNQIIYSKLTDAVVMTARFMVPQHQKSFPKSSPPIVIFPGYEQTKKSITKTAIRKELGFGENDILSAICARLSTIKGHSVAIRALKKIVPNFPEAKLLIIGEDTDNLLKDLRLLVNQLNLEKNVFFINHISNLSLYLHAFDIGLISSLGSEAICRIGIEFMANGVPIIASNINALSEIIVDGVNGLHFDVNNSDMLADKWLSLLNNPEKRMQLSRQAEEHFLMNFRIDKVADQYIQLFNKLLLGR